ncbi:MAG: DUF488 domain-containing protein [Trueperaceae bacterium]
MSVRCKRAYLPPEPADGTRVLVDRLWPRGVRKDAARIDWWAKDLAPSDALRRWFEHEPERFGAFRQRYAAEIEGSHALARLRALVRDGSVTLVYAAKDERHNNAVVLAEMLEG